MKFDRDKYLKYLKSKKWRAIRKNILDERGCRCQKCKKSLPSKELHIHHMTYKHLFNEEEHKNDLIILCENCHNELHRANKAGVVTLRGKLKGEHKKNTNTKKSKSKKYHKPYRDNSEFAKKLMATLERKWGNKNRLEYVK